MNLIVAVDRNWAIGKDGDQLVYIPADLKRFQALTMGHALILGRKTLATFPKGLPLAGRRNLILSRDSAFSPTGGEVFRSLDSLLAAAPEDAFVVGGESVYRALLPHCDTAYVTKIDHTYPADVFFPDLDIDAQWYLAQEEAPLEQKGLSFRYLTYRRR
ncbi:MAG: dihydrofolate reductase [Oscillospiraceae bacterium]|nr:dihydrofolate reductase [Oscillospiraceae bacterium]